LPNLLENLQLEELSLVDRPANAQAMVSLFKRDNSEKDVNKMDDEMEAKVKAYMEKESCGRDEAMKALGYDMPKPKTKAKPDPMEAMKADVARLTAEVDRLQKGLDEAGYVVSADVIEKKAAVEMIEVGGVSIAKSEIPAPVLKALEEAEVSKKQHEIEKADIELTKRAGETLPNFDVNVAKSLLKSFADDKAIVEALKAADAAFAAAMDEVGKSAMDGSFANASEEMDAMVKTYMTENNLKKSDYAKAYAAVAMTDKGKALINKSYKGE
jgi:predicted transcriptional regulator